MVNRALIVILATVTLDAIGIGLALPVIPSLLRELSHETRIAGRFGYFSMADSSLYAACLQPAV